MTEDKKYNINTPGVIQGGVSDLAAADNERNTFNPPADAPRYRDFSPENVKHDPRPEEDTDRKARLLKAHKTMKIITAVDALSKLAVHLGGGMVAQGESPYKDVNPLGELDKLNEEYRAELGRWNERKTDQQNRALEVEGQYKRADDALAYQKSQDEIANQHRADALRQNNEHFGETLKSNEKQGAQVNNRFYSGQAADKKEQENLSYRTAAGNYIKLADDVQGQYDELSTRVNTVGYEATPQELAQLTDLQKQYKDYHKQAIYYTDLSTGGVKDAPEGGKDAPVGKETPGIYSPSMEEAQLEAQEINGMKKMISTMGGMDREELGSSLSEMTYGGKPLSSRKLKVRVDGGKTKEITLQDLLDSDLTSSQIQKIMQDNFK